MKRLHVTSVAAFLAGCLSLGGCGLLSDSHDEGGRWEVQPGDVVFYGDTSAVELASDTVRAGAPLHVSATTFGNGCTRPAGMRAEVRGLEAILTPLDSVYVPGPNEACTLILNVLDHRADVAFERAGEARIVIQGMGRGPSFEEPAEAVRLERTVVVVE